MTLAGLQMQYMSCECVQDFCNAHNYSNHHYLVCWSWPPKCHTPHKLFHIPMHEYRKTNPHQSLFYKQFIWATCSCLWVMPNVISWIWASQFKLQALVLCAYTGTDNCCSKVSNTQNNGTALWALYHTPIYTNQASRLDQITLEQHVFISTCTPQPARVRICTIWNRDMQSYIISWMGVYSSSSGGKMFWFCYTTMLWWY
jgi:hypothetical protein